MQRKARLAQISGSGGLRHGENEKPHREEGRQNRHPEHELEVVVAAPHQQDRDRRAEEGPDRIERLPQPKCRPAQLGGCEIGDERVPRRAAYPLADAIEEARGDERVQVLRQRKSGLGQRRQAIADDGEELAPPEPIRERAGENLDDRRRRLGDAFDHAHLGHRGAERRDQIDREKRMDHLGGDVHQQRDEAQRPDALRDFSQALRREGKERHRISGGGLRGEGHFFGL